jgi:uncharacterized protein with WD repeat
MLTCLAQDFTKASVKPISGLRDFECSPSDDIVAYWTPEEDHKPARIVLLSKLGVGAVWSWDAMVWVLGMPLFAA